MSPRDKMQHDEDTRTIRIEAAKRIKQMQEYALSKLHTAQVKIGLVISEEMDKLEKAIDSQNLIIKDESRG